MIFCSLVECVGFESKEKGKKGVEFSCLKGLLGRDLA